MTYAQLLSEGKQTLSAAGIAEAELDAWYLLSYVTGMSRALYLLHGPEPVLEEDKTVKTYRALLAERAGHVPLQHLTGEQIFMGYAFHVDARVLVPRQDTECLVETVAEHVQKRLAAAVEKSLRILDLCTGSGCIAVSLKKLFPTAEVTATDISADALSLARENAKRLEADIAFLQGDLFAPVTGRFDVIVSNPPYIETETIETLAPEVYAHEPRIALDGGADGLCFYRQIAKEAKQFLRPNGMLYLEIGSNQGGAVTRLLSENGFCAVQGMQDLAGLDRIVCGICKPCEKEMEASHV